MTDASYFRQQAHRCRELLKVAILPEVREQLRLWAEEFEGRARCLSERGRHSVGSPRRSLQPDRYSPRATRH
jgi:hypothetical protein